VTLSWNQLTDFTRADVMWRGKPKKRELAGELIVRVIPSVKYPGYSHIYVMNPKLAYEDCTKKPVKQACVAEYISHWVESACPNLRGDIELVWTESADLNTWEEQAPWREPAWRANPT
jgi:hypothetical protein